MIKFVGRLLVIALLATSLVGSVYSASSNDTQVVQEYRVQPGETITFRITQQGRQVDNVTVVVDQRDRSSVVQDSVRPNVVTFNKEGIYYLEVGIGNLLKSVKVSVGSSVPMYGSSITMNYANLNVYFKEGNEVIKARETSPRTYLIPVATTEVYLGKLTNNNELILAEIGRIANRTFISSVPSVTVSEDRVTINVAEALLK